MFYSRLTTHDSRLTTLTAQALAELAIFGSILLMLLGVLVNYGLRYNFQQQVIQQAFRKAIAHDPATPESDTNLILKDKYIPDPVNHFGVGSFVPVSASASVTRSYALDAGAESAGELPKLIMQINGQEQTYRTAGFRIEENIDYDLNLIYKYQEIYGGTALDGCKAAEQVCVYSDDGVYTCTEEASYTGNGTCIKGWISLLDGSAINEDLETLKVMTTGTDTDGNTVTEETPVAIKAIRIVDAMAGEIVDYGGALRQCRMITNPAFCKQECEKGKKYGSTKDCNTICDSSMQAPWYCEEGKLDQLFTLESNRYKAMGLQPDFTKDTTISNSLERDEDQAGITTKEKVNYQEATGRKVIYHDGLNPTTGINTGLGNVKTAALSSTAQVTTCAQDPVGCPYGYKITYAGTETAGEKIRTTTW